MLHMILATFAVTTLLAAGCGGSSKSLETTSSATRSTAATTTSLPSAASVPTVMVTMASGKPLSRAHWLAKGDPICAYFNREINKLGVKSTGELPRVLPQAAVYLRAKATQLAKLVPPISKASDWQAILNATLQVAEDGDKLATYTNLGNAITNTPLAKTITALDDSAQSIAKSDGFKECSR